MEGVSAASVRSDEEGSIAKKVRPTTPSLKMLVPVFCELFGLINYLTNFIIFYVVIATARSNDGSSWSMGAIWSSTVAGRFRVVAKRRSDQRRKHQRLAAPLVEQIT